MKYQYKQGLKNSFSLLLFLVFTITSVITISCSNKDDYKSLDPNTVTFNLDGGSAVDAQVVSQNNKATKPSPDPTKAGYRFDGWYQNSGKTKIFDFNTPITANTIIYAKWIALYKVTFDVDGGSAVATQTIDGGTQATKPLPNPTKSGFSFGDWYQESGKTKPFDFNTPITANTTIYVKWISGTVEKYTVTFDVDNGSAVVAQNVDKGDKATKPDPDPTRSGYDFLGWYEDSGKTKIFDFNTLITANTTIYAKWTMQVAGQSIVMFDVDNGSAITAQTVNNGDKATRPSPDPTRSGYSFDGWFKTSAKTTPFDFNDPINTNTTIYAKWTELIYRVMFNVDGGDPVADRMVTNNTTTAKPSPDPTRIGGYRFDGWYQDMGKTIPFNFNNPITADTTIYIKWIKQYRIIFNVDNGSAVADQMVDMNSSATKPAPDPTRTGYRFDGWFKDMAKTTPFNFGARINVDETIYAKWVRQFRVTFNVDNGSAVADQMVDMNSSATKPAPDPTRSGYRFDGWFRDMAKTTPFNFGARINVDETIYAKWTRVHSVMFDEDGGSAVADRMVDDNTPTTRPSNPTRGADRFEGWFKTSAKTTPFDFNDPITADTTIYAKWTVVYRVMFNTDVGDPVTEQMVDKNAKATEPSEQIKYGYRFEGWFKDNAKMMPFNFNDPITADTTIYAKWRGTTEYDMFDINGRIIDLNSAVNATSQGYNNIKSYRTLAFIDPEDEQSSTQLSGTSGGHYESTNKSMDGMLLQYTFNDAVDIESYEIMPRSRWETRARGLTIVMYDASGTEIGTRQFGVGVKSVLVANVKKIALVIPVTSTQSDPITQFNYITVKVKK